jgi:hypothetical protein
MFGYGTQETYYGYSRMMNQWERDAWVKFMAASLNGLRAADSTTDATIINAACEDADAALEELRKRVRGSRTPDTIIQGTEGYWYFHNKERGTAEGPYDTREAAESAYEEYRRGGEWNWSTLSIQ